MDHDFDPNATVDLRPGYPDADADADESDFNDVPTDLDYRPAWFGDVIHPNA